MSRAIQVLSLILLQVLVVFALFQSLTERQSLIAISVYVILGVLFVRLRPFTGFVALVALTLTLAFGFIFQGWKSQWTIRPQTTAIVHQLLFTVSAAVLWLEVYSLKKMSLDFSRMQQQIEDLKKYDEESSLLTPWEFRERLESIIINMKRRDEHGMMIMLTLEQPYAPSVLVFIANAALNSIRSKYDVVGRLSEHTIAIGLQNCDVSAVHVVVSRMYELLENEYRVNLASLENKLKVETIILGDNWSEIISRLQ